MSVLSLSFDSYGNIYVTDTGNQRIQKFVLASNSCCKCGKNICQGFIECWILNHIFITDETTTSQNLITSGNTGILVFWYFTCHESSLYLIESSTMDIQSTMSSTLMSETSITTTSNQTSKRRKRIDFNLFSIQWHRSSVSRYTTIIIFHSINLPIVHLQRS